MGAAKFSLPLRVVSGATHVVAAWLILSRLVLHICPVGWLSDGIAGVGRGSMSEGHEAAQILHEAVRGKEDVRVYVYTLPPKYNRLQVEKSHAHPAPIRDPYCDTNFYSAEVKVHHALLRSTARTKNAAEAHFFYVPIYVTCFLINNHPNNLTRTGMFFDEAMQYVRTKYPFFNASQGRDHVYTFAQGFGGRLAGSGWKEYRAGIFLTHNGDFRGAEGEFTLRKDIVIPPALGSYLRPVYIDKDAGREMDVLERRPHLAMFGGQSFSTTVQDDGGRNYSGGVRQWLVRHGRKLPGFHISGVRAEDYVENMRRSLFCVAPEGWHAWSPRPYYAILLGCVPVVVSERQELAFEDVIPYDRVAVWIRPREVEEMNDVLRGISVDEVVAKVRVMERIWPLLWYEGARGMAVDGILGELGRRRYKSEARREYRRRPVGRVKR